MKTDNLTQKTHTSIIRPVKGKRDPQLGPDSLMILIPSELKYLTTITNAKRHPMNDISMHQLYLVDIPQKGPVAISGPFLGAPQAVLAMEKLIALGMKRLWVMGWCGSISRQLCMGDMFIPTSAFSDEGTSAHYPIGINPPRSDNAMSEALVKRLTKEGFSPVKGLIWTTDAPYRETPEKVEKFQALGAMAVDMEMSALMTVSIYRSVAVTALLVVSDELFDLTWRTGFSSNRVLKATRSAAEILLKTALEYEQS